jgi:uncharacterized membrane protein
VSPEQIYNLDFNNVLVVLTIAASPISELRGAIPWAILEYHFPWYYAYLLAVIGNILPVPFILLFLNTFTRLISKIGFFNRLLQWYFEKTRQRAKLIEKYSRVGLILFVAIPLPITGAWTGSIAAVLLGLKFKHAFLSICIGVLIAGVIVTCATMLSWTIFSL